MSNAIKVLTHGYSGIGQIGQAWGPDTVQRFPLGTTIQVIDPYWGAQELIYLKVDVRGTNSVVGAVKQITDGWVASAAATPAVGYPLCVALNKIDSNGVYAWFLLCGRFPVNSELGCTVGGTLSVYNNSITPGADGSRIQGMVLNVTANTGDGTFTNLAISKGSKLFYLFGDSSAFDLGLFVGQRLTGTGIASESIITNIDVDGMRLTMNNAATASGAPTVTKQLKTTLEIHYWNICTFFNPYAAGAV